MRVLSSCLPFTKIFSGGDGNLSVSDLNEKIKLSLRKDPGCAGICYEAALFVAQQDKSISKQSLAYLKY